MSKNTFNYSFLQQIFPENLCANKHYFKYGTQQGESWVILPYDGFILVVQHRH
jgi:hypothetical protein